MLAEALRWDTVHCQVPLPCSTTEVTESVAIDSGEAQAAGRAKNTKVTVLRRPHDLQLVGQNLRRLGG